MKLRFNYRSVPTRQPIVSLRGAAARPRPLVRSRLIAAQGRWAPHGAKFDTGADDTLFPWQVGLSLGIDLANAPKGQAHGLGSAPFEVRYADVHVQITDDYQAIAEWSAIIAFTQQTMDYALLGFAGCLEFFTSTFDGERELATLEPNGKFHSIAQGSVWKAPSP